VADSGFSVITSAVSSHGTSADVAADGVDQAADAGLHTLNPLAYGAMNAMIPVAINPIQALAVLAIRDEAKTLHSVGDLLRQIAASYDHTEEEAAKKFEDIARKLESKP
jgi:hypothetical protein